MRCCYLELGPSLRVVGRYFLPILSTTFRPARLRLKQARVQPELWSPSCAASLIRMVLETEIETEIFVILMLGQSTLKFRLESLLTAILDFSDNKISTKTLCSFFTEFIAMKTYWQALLKRLIHGFVKLCVFVRALYGIVGCVTQSPIHINVLIQSLIC